MRQMDKIMKSTKFSKGKKSTTTVLDVKKDVYQTITDRIIALIEDGVNPWRKTWKVENGSFAGAKNFISGKPYRGINHFILSCTAFNCPYFLTMKQVNDKGGRVLQGEKATPILFAKSYLYKDSKEVDGQVTEEDKKGFCYKIYHVFNLEQTTLEIPVVETVEDDKNAKIQICESIYSGYKNAPKLLHGGASAYYSPTNDIVKMPVMSCFDNSEAYYATLFHELIHSTGHARRLEREGIVNFDRFDSQRYSSEELVAEMGASFLNALCGTSSPDLERNTAAYVKGWLVKLKSDNKFIFRAAAQAQKAVVFIIGEDEGEEENS